MRYGPADGDRADRWAQTMGWRVEARGATSLWEASQGPYAWVTRADPEGNEFCIS
nr:VOC family protein [Arthrobacter alpinus]